MKQIFVYGSLREGLFNYDIYLEGKVSHIEEAYVRGKLYSLKGKPYPAFVPGYRGWVRGQIMTLKSRDTLKELDKMEGFISIGNKDNEYNREPVDVYNLAKTYRGTFDTYVFNFKHTHRARELKHRIHHGDFVKHYKLVNSEE